MELRKEEEREEGITEEWGRRRESQLCLQIQSVQFCSQYLRYDITSNQKVIDCSSDYRHSNRNSAWRWIWWRLDISLAGTAWDKTLLAIAEEVALSFDRELGIFAFRTLLSTLVRSFALSHCIAYALLHLKISNLACVAGVVLLGR
ncbi:hypothetical protein M9H77_31519 [Catharanthus roseus]|uniref:Uncharacterized protein n=1 Tax=Catharanthus roseus TaxID=4058 RepID=A0ACC0A312_CATRO|nr:hypothetical protein M9H77_31519 [Catharanthus roseus]